MADNLFDLYKARRKRRDQSGWTLEESKNNAEKEYKAFRKIAEDEPSALISGDMDKIIRGEDDEDDKE